MNSIRKSERVKTFLVFSLISFGALGAFGTTYNWTGNAPAPNNQYWSNPQNWSPSGGPPAAGDTASINSPGVGTVQIDVPATVANFTAISAILRGSGSLTVSGTLEAQNADMGPGGGITIKGTGTLSVEPVPNIAVYNTTTIASLLTVNGSANVSSNAVLFLNPGAMSSTTVFLL